jgi:uncharacterized protein YggE
MRRLLLIGALLAAVLVAAAFTRAGSTSSGRTATTVGHGAVTVVPDQATIGAGVRTTAPTAAAALAANSSAVARVIAALKRVGVKTIQTQQVSLYPQTDAKSKVTGYVAQNTVTVTAPVADAGKLIDAAVGAGADTVDGPSLGVSIQGRLYRQALQQAVADARAKAGALAHAGGFGIGRVLTVSEQSQQPPVVYAAAGKDAGSTPVEPGTQTVTADVQVTFALR